MGHTRSAPPTPFRITVQTSSFIKRVITQLQFNTLLRRDSDSCGDASCTNRIYVLKQNLFIPPMGHSFPHQHQHASDFE